MTDGMFQVLPSFHCEGLLEIFEIRSGVIESICLYQNLTRFVWSWLSWLFSISFFLFVYLSFWYYCWCCFLFLRAFVTHFPSCAPVTICFSLSLSPVLFHFCHPRLPLDRVSDSLRFVPKYLVWSLSRFHIWWDGNFTLRKCDPSIWLCCILGQVCF